ncbi:helix-turn-helix domain-containing protein [Kordia sp. YSTF-M3]|uniref:Helix-turn-helix domain-containing protein n=1 Tax=Kordia aestuariivivens TaxID=2759037 RepID=A0ABR7Q894_9FLAO|nr:helix-turn-helix domain-containing protein [Kordia aestuariivivens]MBC8754747.1 helix-turn-helix domain-containing protein [Kordia aestuariivivens]
MHLAEKNLRLLTKQFILWCFAFTCCVNAQTNSNASYKELIESYREFRSKERSKALAFAIEAKGVALVNGNNTQLAEALYYISTGQYNLAENKEALKNIELAIAEASSIKNTLFLYKDFLLKGDILSELGEDSKALIAYLKAKEYAEEIGDPINEVLPLFRIAHIKKIHKDFQEAIRINKEVLNRLNILGANVNTNYYRLNAFMNIADTYLWLENPDEAEFYNKAGLKKCSDTIMPETYYTLVMNKAIIHYQREQYHECLVVAEEVGEYSLKTKNESLYVTSLFYLGKSYSKLNEHEKSLGYLEKIQAIMSASDNVDVNEKELNEFLFLGYYKKEKHEKALLHFQKYKELEKKESAQDLKINNEIHKLHDIVPLHKEIDTLGEELTKQTNNKRNLVIVSLGLCMLFLMTIVYYIIKGKVIKKKFKELLKKVSDLENNNEKQVVPRKDIVTDEKVEAILKKIATFEKEEQYLEPACSLSFMAENLETNTAYLSKVINTHKGKSYTVYITELRLNKALIRLKNDKKLQSYTIKAIAEEFGFKRQETFARAFKAHTGIYPSQYLKNLQNKT